MKNCQTSRESTVEIHRKKICGLLARKQKKKKKIKKLENMHSSMTCAPAWTLAMC